jgi:hypothetical protein
MKRPTGSHGERDEGSYSEQQELDRFWREISVPPSNLRETPWVAYRPQTDVNIHAYPALLQD